MNLKLFIKITFLYFILIPNISSSQIKSDNIKEIIKENNTTIKFLNSNSEANNKNIIQITNLKDILIKNNKELKILQNRVEEAKATFKSKLAAWYPRFYLNSNDLPKYAIGNEYNNLDSDTSTDKLSLGINANIDWDIINPKRRLEIAIAKEELGNSELVFESKKNNLLLDAFTLFYNIQASYQEIEVAKKSIEISNIALTEAEEKYNSGIGNKLEVLEAKTQLDRDQIKLMKKKGELNKSKNSLFLLLNIEDIYDVKKNNRSLIGYLWDKNFDQSLSEAYINRKDLEIKNKNVSINKKKSLSILSGKKPNLTFYNQYSLSTTWGESNVSTKPDYANQNKSNINNVGIKFNWNLFDGGLIKQNYLASESRSNELKEELQLSRNQIKKELIDAFINLDISKENIIYSFNQLKAAKETLEISLKRLYAGLTTQREIINIQADVSESESNFINAITEYNITLAKLERLTLVEKKDICILNKAEENESNNYFYKFILENNLKKSCGEII